MSRGVYLIHLERPLHHAQHYIGYAQDVDARFLQHWQGIGNPMLREARRQGIIFRIVHIWKGETRSFERYLKNYKKSNRFCPICNPERAAAYQRRAKKRLDVLIPF
jgi:predicted GIY-YIG superfamily endonuclease